MAWYTSVPIIYTSLLSSLPIQYVILYKKIQPNKNKTIVIPNELNESFQSIPLLKNNYKYFTLGKQREFADYISKAKSAKQAKVVYKK